MKYSVGQKVKIRSLEWYRDNVNRYGIIECGKYEFFEPMNEYCGKVVTIKRIDDDNYRIDTDKGAFCWTDEMIEGLVEEEISQNAKLVSERFSEYVNPSEVKYAQDTITKMLLQGANIPNKYILKDENGKVINATKIILEKKKPKYPKTYEECEKVLRYDSHRLDNMGVTVRGYKWELIRAFQILLICRDAYWKIAGEEMGLGRPWNPTDSEVCYGIFPWAGEIQHDTTAKWCILTFPTEEMRDAFYENFKKEIEICKELL